MKSRNCTISVLRHDVVIKNICNGKVRRTDVATKINQPRPCCYLVDNRKNYLRLGPFKYDVRSVNPFRVVIHEFLDPYEIKQMKKHVLPRLSYNESRSLTVYSDSEAASFPDNYKAATIFLDEKENNLFSKMTRAVNRISKKIKMASHLILEKEDQTDNQFRASVYGLGGMAEEHSDAYGVESEKQLADKFQKYQKIGDLIATIMLYITDVSLGGGTYFSSEKYEDVIFPERGSALLWFNLRSSGFADSRQGHGGCPVAEGYKFTVTKWFHQYYQWKKFKCSGDTLKYIDVEQIITSSTRKLIK